MNKRVRLTKRMAADGSIPYPGNVNQPGRTDPAWDEYHTFEQQVNHELPDMRTEWKDDSRDDVGFGIPEANPPTVASVRVAANKAVRIAVLLLGEKVADSVIEAQARDFMSLTQESMDRTLDRFAKTQKLYADEDEGEEEEEKEAKSKKADEDEDEAKDKKASKALADKGSAVPPAISLKETEVKAEEKKEEEKPAEVKAEKKEIPEFIQKKIDESKEKKSAEEDKKEEDKKEAKVEVKAEEKKDEEKKEAKVEVKATDDKDEDDKVEARLAKIEAMIASLTTSKKAEDKKEEEEKKEAKVEVKAEDEKKEDEKKEAKVEAKADEEEEKEEKKEAKKASPNEMDIELTSSMDDALPADPVADAQLASLFANDGLTAAADEEEKDEAEKKAKAKKAGIKKLGGQPKVAAESGAAVDIGSIWESAPDVSEVFK